MPIHSRLRSDHVADYIKQSTGSDRNKRWPDGKNLYLVTRNGRGFWVLQYRDGDKIRSKGLGSAKTVTVAQARKLREDFAVRRRAGELPATRGVGKRFTEAAADYLTKHAGEWSPKQQKDHRRRLKLHTSALDNRRVHRITVDEIADVLRPIWTGPNHGRGAKLRGLIELILNAEKVQQPGPAAWSRLKEELGKDNLVKVSHPALHYTEVPALMAELQSDETTQARAIRFVILTGVRQQEALGATWAELHAKGEMIVSADGVFRPLDGDTWIIPASRMKAGREHRVPLTKEMLALLGERGPDNAFVFPSGRGSGQLSHNATYELLKTLRPTITLHGFRSTFVDWAAQHEYARELRELALAHVVGDNVFQAYNRDPLVERRRPMMEQWAKYATGKKQ
jgi:integrase